MKRSHILFTGLTCALLLFLSACTSDDGNKTGLPPGTENPDPDGSGGEEIPLVEGLTVYKPSKFYDGYTLVNDAAANRVYLMDKKTSVVFEWNMDGKRLGNDAHLMENGKIQDAAVIGVPDDRLGEIVTAIIKVKPDQEISEEEVLAFCEGLPRYKRPRKVFFGDVPRNPTGKIEKPKLRKKYAGMQESFKV